MSISRHGRPHSLILNFKLRAGRGYPAARCLTADLDAIIPIVDAEPVPARLNPKD